SPPEGRRRNRPQPSRTRFRLSPPPPCPEPSPSLLIGRRGRPPDLLARPHVLGMEMTGPMLVGAVRSDQQAVPLRRDEEAPVAVEGELQAVHGPLLRPGMRPVHVSGPAE